MSKYKLTISMTTEAQDDLAARKQAQEVEEAVKQVTSNIETKFKQVYTDQPPRGVRMT